MDVRRASAEDLPYEEGTFDVALAQLVVHFIAEPVAGLREMARVTEPFGSTVNRLAYTCGPRESERMRLRHLCDLELHYDSDFHLVRPYGNESGTGWGRGGGSVTGDRLQGDYTWSNHPRRRGDGMMLPAVRGVVTTGDDAELILELSGRTSFGPDGVGHQMMFALFESEHPAYSWLNDVVCLAEGRIDQGMKSAIVVWVCEPGDVEQAKASD